MILRPYQQKFLWEFEAKIAAGIKRILGVAPTGSGKTIIAAEIIRRAQAERKRIVFIAHRDELLTQARDKLGKFDVVAGIIKSGRDRDQRPQSLVQICGVQTLHTRGVRLKTMDLPPAELVIVDEAHHVRAQTYQDIIKAYPDAIILGLTATPCRGDGRGLGNVFDCIIECPQVAELIKLAHLVPAKIFAPNPHGPDLRGVDTAATGDYVISQLSERVDTDALVGDFVEHWLRLANRARTVVFAVRIGHSEHIVRELRKANVRAEHLDGQTDDKTREQILARLASGETEVVSNCAVLTEGFDCPDIGCIGLMRPTKSLLLYRQMLGRGLRPAEGKTHCLILDHAGAVHRHGRPDDAIEWTLHTDQRAVNKAHEHRKTEYNNDPFTECKSCGHIRQKGMACDNCGWQPSPKALAIDYIDEDLVEIGATERASIDRLTFYRELRGYAKAARKKDGTPYSDGWAYHKFIAKFGEPPPYDWKSYPPALPTEATGRWIRSRIIAYARARNPA